MPTTTPLKHRRRSMRVARVEAERSALRTRIAASPVRDLRETLKLPRPLFARLMGCSDRALANWEAGRALPEIYKSRLHELQKLYAELSESVEPKTIGSWITTPNAEFDGLKPLELIERGETFRIWRMIFLLKAGVAL